MSQPLQGRVQCGTSCSSDSQTLVHCLPWQSTLRQPPIQLFRDFRRDALRGGLLKTVLFFFLLTLP
eukprot:508241-Rhodomonas_salina.1